MKLVSHFRQALLLMIFPSREWLVIRDAPYTMQMLLYNYALPIVIFSAFGKTIGSIFSVQSYWGLSWFMLLFPVFNFLAWIAISYLIIFFSVIILNGLVPSFGAERSMLNTYKLVIFAYTPLLIVTFFVYLHPILRLLIPIGLPLFGAYSLYVLWYGVQDLFQMPFERRIGFIASLMLLELLFFFFLGRGMVFMTDFFFPGMSIYIL
jgi:Yip1 domain